MSKKRLQHIPKLKDKVTLEALNGIEQVHASAGAARDSPRAGEATEPETG